MKSSVANPRLRSSWSRSEFLGWLARYCRREASLHSQSGCHFTLILVAASWEVKVVFENPVKVKVEPIRLEKVKKLSKRENSLFGSAGFWQKKDKVSFRSPHPQKRVWAVFWSPAYPSRWPWSTRWSWCRQGAQQTRRRGSTVQFRLCSMQFQSMSPSCSLFLLQGQPWIIFHIWI